MKGYLSIGKVAKLKNVSIKSLRYYDEIGILKPAYINTQTNYRYYKQEQLMIIDAITLCIELGIPLKEFEKYKDPSGTLRLSDLLIDGKLQAEKKIKAMSTRLETLQQTISILEAKEDRLPASVCQATHRQLSQNIFTTIKTLPERTLLLTPFDEFTTANQSSQKLLELLVTAQKAGLSSSYPSGVLYEYSSGSIKKFVFLHILCKDKDDLLNILALEKNILGNCRIKHFEAMDYACYECNESSIEQGKEFFNEFLLEKTSYTLVEQKNIEEKGKPLSSPFELQLPL